MPALNLFPLTAVDSFPTKDFGFFHVKKLLKLNYRRLVLHLLSSKVAI
jgi:hypothetical protein